VSFIIIVKFIKTIIIIIILKFRLEPKLRVRFKFGLIIGVIVNHNFLFLL